MIALSDCENLRLYRICSRNLAYGVFCNRVPYLDRFFGIREKFDSTFVDSEKHWNHEGPFGTAIPLVALSDFLPETISFAYSDHNKLFAWLVRMEQKHGLPTNGRGSHHGPWPMGLQM